MMDFKELSRPFPPEEIEWRIGATNADKTKGMALAYLNARAVMERLDEVCGPEGWQCRYPHANGKTCCEIGIKIGDEWVWKSDGAGDTDVEGVKGAFSDAFKRAAVRFGIGRYLYSIQSPWVKISKKGNSHIIADGEHLKLNRALEQNEWHGPLGKMALKEKATALFHRLTECAEEQDIADLVNENSEVIEQLIKDSPHSWYGQGEQVGLQDRIERRRAEVQMQERDRDLRAAG